MKLQDLMSFWESSYKRELVEGTFPTGTIAFRAVFESKRLRSHFGSRCGWDAGKVRFRDYSHALYAPSMKH